MYEPQFRCSNSKVPILSHEEIEQDAEMFIMDFEPELLERPREVDIERFVEYYLRLTPEYNNLTHCGLILGRMVFNDNDRIPVYDAEAKRAEYISAKRGTVMIDNTLLDDEHRFRSTMGHEAGHWIYQQSYFYADPCQMSLFDNMDNTTTACRKSDIEGGECSDGGRKTLSSDHDWLEHQAKYFSAAILMPRKAMKVVCGNKEQRASLRAEFPGFEEEMLASHVADVFNVSVESAKIRIRQLGLGFQKLVTPNPTIFTIGYPSKVFSI
jgi:hypothetical protein